MNTDKADISRWMVEFEVESEVSLADGYPSVTFNDPRKRYSIQLRDFRRDPGQHRPSILANVIFESDLDGKIENLKKIKEMGTIFLKEFLATLSLVTKLKHEIIECRKVVDWRLGLPERLVQVYKTFPIADIPIPGLTDKSIESAEYFAQREISPKIENAVRWFWRGANCTHLDDQFQCFWFSLETLSSHLKPKDKVPSPCPKCKGALFCQQCNEAPLHKPFPKQAIESLLKKNYAKKPDQKTIEQLFEIRNRLMHGEFIEEIESDLKISMQNINDHLGNFIWVGIVSAFKYSQESKVTLDLFDPSTFSKFQEVAGVTAILGNGALDPLNLDPTKVPNVQLERVVGDLGKKSEETS